MEEGEILRGRAAASPKAARAFPWMLLRTVTCKRPEGPLMSLVSFDFSFFLTSLWGCLMVQLLFVEVAKSVRELEDLIVGPKFVGVLPPEKGS